MKMNKNLPYSIKEKRREVRYSVTVRYRDGDNMITETINKSFANNSWAQLWIKRHVDFYDDRAVLNITRLY
jgi:hypothetical protein